MCWCFLNKEPHAMTCLQAAMNGGARSHLCCNFQTTAELWFFAVRDETAKAKKRGARGDKVKR